MSRMIRRRNLYFAVTETVNIAAGIALAGLFVYLHRLDLSPLIFVLSVATGMGISFMLYKYVVLDLIFNWADRKSRQES